MKQQDVERNRKPLNRYKRTFREQGGKLDKSTPEGIAAWGIRKVMAMNPTTAGDERLAALETWEWDTTMRIREVEALEQIAKALKERRHAKALEALNGRAFLETETETEGPSKAIEETITSYLRLAIPEIGFGLDVRSYDDEPAAGWADSTAEWSFANPAEVRAFAEALRTVYADAIEGVADLWEAGRDAGDIPTAESRR